MNPYHSIVKPDCDFEVDHLAFVQPYLDLALAQRDAMMRLVKAFQKLGLIVYVRRCRAKIGMFTVCEKDGKLRLGV